MSTRLLLIRHGETRANARKLYAGSMDPDLNARGVRQALAARQTLGGLAVHRVYSSSQRRALRSARLIFPQARLHVRRALREIHFGAIEGLSHRQCLARHRRAYNNWLDSAFKRPVRGGEGYSGFRKRVLRSLGRIVSANPRVTTAVVTHGGPIRVALNELQGRNATSIRFPALAGVYSIDWRGSWAKSRLS